MKHPQIIRKEKYIELIKDLINQGFARNQIQEKLNWTNRQLTNFIYNHKIKLSRYNNIFPNKEQTQVIIGSLLGDGSISYSGKYSKNCRLQISHSMKQLEYLKYKYNILKNLCNTNVTIRKRYDKRFKEPIYNQCEIKTKSLKIFSNYRKRWYINGQKKLDISNIYNLEALGLAIWFMDDGYKAGKSFIFATQSFIKQDLIILQNILLNKFNIKTIIRKNNEIYVRVKSAKILINLIEPYIINSMKYKIAPIKKSDEFRETPEVDNPEPSS